MSEDTSMRMIVNGQFHCFLENGTQALGHTLELGIDRLHFMSDDGIRNWLLEAIALAEEVLSWGTDTPLKKRITMYKKSLDNIRDRKGYMNLFINIAMACNGLGTLSGFGMAMVSQSKGKVKRKSSLWLNPEKMSIY